MTEYINNPPTDIGAINKALAQAKANHPPTHWLILFSDAAGWTVLRDSTETNEIMTFASKEEAEAQAKIEEADYRDAYDHHSPEELEEIVPEYKVISNQCDFSYHDEGAQT